MIQKIMKEEKIPEEWRKSPLIPIFKEKVTYKCCNIGDIKLMAHTLMLLERLRDRRLMDEVEKGRERLGFMKERRTEGIFCLRQLMEKYREEQRPLHRDVEKAYDHVPRQG